MAEGVNRSIKLPQPSLFGRIGTGFGKGLAESLPKEIERGRLQQGLQDLGNQKDQSLFQQFAGLAGLPGTNPQIIQSGSDLLRQQALIDSFKQNEQAPPPPPKPPENVSNDKQKTATSPESTKANLEPYIPPSGEEQEYMARKLHHDEPKVYPRLEDARAAISNRIAADTAKSNAEIQRGELEKGVQNTTEQKLRDEISLRNVGNIPGTLLSRLQQDAVDEVTAGKLSYDEAKTKYGKIATKIDEDFNTIKGWGGLGLVGKSAQKTLDPIASLQKDAKKGEYQKQAADQMIASNKVTPEFAYGSMFPVSDKKELNNTLKSLPDIKRTFNPVSKNEKLTPERLKNSRLDPVQETQKIAPILAKEMGLDGSPLAIAYELRRKGYDADAWMKYLDDRKDQLNLSSRQSGELSLNRPSYFGNLNDLWLSSFTGVK